MSSQAGLSLLEVLVTLTLVTLTTLLIGSAFPVIRERRALEQTKQQVTAAIRAAQIQALDEQRQTACLDRVGGELRQQKLCSDIGVFLAGGQLQTFADTHDNNQFDQDDFLLGTAAFPNSITAAVPASLLFEATPPNIILYVNGTIIASGQTATVTFTGPFNQLPLTVSAYGLIQ